MAVTNRTTKAVTALASFDVADGDSGYLGGLARLPLSTGAGPLAPGASGTFVLNSSGAKPGGLARVVLADADSLLPLATYLVAQKPGTADPRTLSDDDVKTAGLALDLCRNLMAAPTSNLAVDLVAATDKKVVTANPDAALADFFATHPPLTGLNVDLLALTIGWTRAYAALWGTDDAGGRGRRYDLYPAPYYGGRADSVGTIEFRPRAGTGGDPADHNSGFTIAFLPATGDPAALHLADLVLGDGAAGRLALAGSYLDPTWLAASRTGQKLWQVLGGQLDGNPVVAIPSAVKAAPAAPMAAATSPPPPPPPP
ncbi:MAG TPA: hypothetical protein VH092_06090, partial [Urbifossiella sp.]|nr:hypothetical protein [Urbifossiella sp.]